MHKNSNYLIENISITIGHTSNSAYIVFITNILVTLYRKLGIKIYLF